jgi:hypothetical protein
MGVALTATPFVQKPLECHSMLRDQLRIASLLLIVAGCQSVRPVRPAEFIPQKNPPMVWVELKQGAIQALDHPRMVGDTIKGTWENTQEDVAIPLNGVESVRVRQFDTARTLALVGIGGAALGVVAYFVSQAGEASYCPPNLAC